MVIRDKEIERNKERITDKSFNVTIIIYTSMLLSLQKTNTRWAINFKLYAGHSLEIELQAKANRNGPHRGSSRLVE